MKEKNELLKFFSFLESNWFWGILTLILPEGIYASIIKATKGQFDMNIVYILIMTGLLLSTVRYVYIEIKELKRTNEIIIELIHEQFAKLYNDWIGSMAFNLSQIMNTMGQSTIKRTAFQKKLMEAFYLSETEKAMREKLLKKFGDYKVNQINNIVNRYFPNEKQLEIIEELKRLEKEDKEEADRIYKIMQDFMKNQNESN